MIMEKWGWKFHSDCRGWRRSQTWPWTVTRNWDVGWRKLVMTPEGEKRQNKNLQVWKIIVLLRHWNSLWPELWAWTGKFEFDCESLTCQGQGFVILWTCRTSKISQHNGSSTHEHFRFLLSQVPLSQHSWFSFLLVLPHPLTCQLVSHPIMLSIITLRFFWTQLSLT